MTKFSKAVFGAILVFLTVKKYFDLHINRKLYDHTAGTIFHRQMAALDSNDLLQVLLHL